MSIEEQMRFIDDAAVRAAAAIVGGEAARGTGPYSSSEGIAAASYQIAEALWEKSCEVYKRRDTAR